MMAKSPGVLSCGIDPDLTGGAAAHRDEVPVLPGLVAAAKEQRRPHDN
jgi:hypothetical protein